MKTETDIKHTHQELLRIVSSDDDLFVPVKNGVFQKHQVFHSQPYFIKIGIPQNEKQTLPILFEVQNINDRQSDLEMYVSMNTKAPSSENYDKKIIKEESTPGKFFKFSYGQSGPEFLKDKKFKNTIFVFIKSSENLKLNMKVNFFEKKVMATNACVGNFKNEVSMGKVKFSNANDEFGKNEKDIA